MKGPRTMAKDYYEVLGVPRDASVRDIKRAYRRLARQCHPDVNRDDPLASERFKEIQTAYAVLGDEEKRRQYDRFGADFDQFQQSGGAGPGGFRFEQAEGVDLSDLGDLGDLFGGLFGRRGRQRAGWQAGFEPRGRRGADVEMVLSVTLEEVDQGATRDLTVSLEDVCAACGGQGRQRGGPCATCHGSGRAPRQRQLTGLRIPPGVEQDAVLRVRGKGGQGVDAPDGDLLLRIQVRDHPFFSRQGNDLECELPVSLAEAVAGAEIPVPTLRGLRPLRIPPGTQSGQRFRIRGHGLPDRKTGQRGNLMVRVQPVVPRDLKPDEVQAIENAAARAPDPRAGLWRPREER